MTEHPAEDRAPDWRVTNRIALIRRLYQERRRSPLGSAGRTNCRALVRAACNGVRSLTGRPVRPGHQAPTQRPESAPPGQSAEVRASFHDADTGRVCRFEFFADNALVRRIEYPADMMTPEQFTALSAEHAAWCA